MSQSLHERMIVVDGLQVGGSWPRKLFEELREGGVTCIHTTSVVWEGPGFVLDDLGRWRRRFEEHADLIMPVYSGEDIDRAKQLGKTGVIYGFQNSSPLEDSLDYVWAFAKLGVRVIQLTYNNQNFVGSSCYEANDSGLSRFGRNVVSEMNRWGVLVDLSHCGDRTSLDAIRHSRRPVAVTHSNPLFFHEHKRNKSNEILKALAESGGMFGCSPYPNLLGENVTIDTWTEMVARLVDLIGIEHVALGSDLAQGFDTGERATWVRMGRWSHQIDYGAGRPGTPWGYVPFPDWFNNSSHFPRLTQALLDRGFNEDEVSRIMGANWHRFFGEAFKPE